jgi:hypothetical protein
LGRKIPESACIISEAGIYIDYGRGAKYSILTIKF